jgi:hypothetical protein
MATINVYFEVSSSNARSDACTSEWYVVLQPETETGIMHEELMMTQSVTQRSIPNHQP